MVDVTERSLHRRRNRSNPSIARREPQVRALSEGLLQFRLSPRHSDTARCAHVQQLAELVVGGEWSVCETAGEMVPVPGAGEWDAALLVLDVHDGLLCLVAMVSTTLGNCEPVVVLGKPLTGRDQRTT